MPSWIERQQGKADRARQARDALVARAARHAADKPAREAFARELEQEALERSRPVPRRGIKPGERKLPDFTDEELRQALGKADRSLPRHLDYPHLLMLRERGFTRMVWADVGAGEFGIPSYRGDVLTEVGELWLKQTS